MKKNIKIIIAIIIVGLIIFGIVFIFNPNMFNPVFKDTGLTPLLKYSLVKASGVEYETIDEVEVEIEKEYYFIINEENKVIDTLVREMNYPEDKLDERYNSLKGQEDIFTSNVSLSDNVIKYNLRIYNNRDKSEISNLLQNIKKNLKVEEI